MPESIISAHREDPSKRARIDEMIHSQYLYHGPRRAMEIVFSDLKRVYDDIVDNPDLKKTKENVETLEMLHLVMTKLHASFFEKGDVKAMEAYKDKVIHMLLRISELFPFQDESGYGKAASILCTSMTTFYPTALTPEDKINQAYQDGIAVRVLEMTLHVANEVDHAVDLRKKKSRKHRD